MLPNAEMDPFFLAAIEATEEAIVNALVAATTMTGVDGHTVPPFTGVTAGPPPSLGEDHAAQIAAASLRRYGRPRDQVAASIERRFRSEGLRKIAIELSEKRI